MEVHGIQLSTITETDDNSLASTRVSPIPTSLATLSFAPNATMTTEASAHTSDVQQHNKAITDLESTSEEPSNVDTQHLLQERQAWWPETQTPLQSREGRKENIPLNEASNGGNNSSHPTTTQYQEHSQHQDLGVRMHSPLEDEVWASSLEEGGAGNGGSPHRLSGGGGNWADDECDHGEHVEDRSNPPPSLDGLKRHSSDSGSGCGHDLRGQQQQQQQQQQCGQQGAGGGAPPEP